MSGCLSPLLPTTWCCPGCNLPLGERKQPIVLHHDHLENVMRGLANSLDGHQLTKPRRPTINSNLFVGFVLQHRRFKPTPVCTDCNHIDGQELQTKFRSPSGFSFSPAQLAALERCPDGKVRMQSAHELWLAYKPQYEAILQAIINDWETTTISYHPEDDFAVPPFEEIAYVDIDTIFESLTFEDSTKVRKAALKALECTIGLKVEKALSDAFLKKRLLNAGIQQDTMPADVVIRD